MMAKKRRRIAAGPDVAVKQVPIEYTGYKDVEEKYADGFIVQHDTHIDVDWGNLEREFSLLAQQWRRDTMAMSSDKDIVLHPAYYQMIGMGRPALPLILRELKERGGHWFLALRAITRENPVKPEDKGRIPNMTAAWLRWGEEHGYLSNSEDGLSRMDT
jgi:hypothetical protein